MLHWLNLEKFQDLIETSNSIFKFISSFCQTFGPTVYIVVDLNKECKMTHEQRHVFFPTIYLFDSIASYNSNCISNLELANRVDIAFPFHFFFAIHSFLSTLADDDGDAIF